MDQNNALVHVERGEFELIRDQAIVLHKSGFLPAGVKTPEAAIAIIITGRELGIPAMAALRGIDIIQGTPSISPALMLALAFRSKALADFEVLESTEDLATVRVQRRGFPPRIETFTIRDAEAMGLAQKDNWKKQRRVMLRWRAIAAALRIDFADIFFGIYLPDELGADIDPASGEYALGSPSPHPEAGRPAQAPTEAASAPPEATGAASPGYGQMPPGGAYAQHIRRPGSMEVEGDGSPMSSIGEVAEGILDHKIQAEAEGLAPSTADMEFVETISQEIVALTEKIIPPGKDPGKALIHWIRKNYGIEGGLLGLPGKFGDGAALQTELIRIRDQFQEEYEARVGAQITASTGVQAG